MVSRRQMLHTLLLFGSLLLAGYAHGEDAPTLDQRVDAAIKKVRDRELRTDEVKPWVIMHATIPFEQAQTVVTPEGKRLNAIAFLLNGARDDEKQTRLYVMENGTPSIRTRGIAPGFKASFFLQDHVDQYLYGYADADMPLTAQGVATQADGSDIRFTIRDLLDGSMRTFKPDQELGWTLVVTSHYLPIDAEWQTDAGTKMSTADILALAVKRDARRETEGGTHHLFGIGYALDKYRQANPDKALEGPWKDAREYLDKHIAITKDFQNEDGSFSSAIFRSRQQAPSAKTMVWATGHSIEWLTVAMDREQLKEPWMLHAVQALADTINATDLGDLSDGGMYHAAHALIRWRDKTAEKP